jgi:uncharacterized protein involved in outer membrane biogenesis
MKAMKKTLLIAAAVVVVVGIAAAIVLPRMLNPERYRPKLQQMLADVTGRTCSVGALTLHVFPAPGISAGGFMLGEDPTFGTEPFLTAGRIEARVKLMPLFSSRLDVTSFDIEKPVARLHRDAKGRWNLVSLMERASKPGAASAGSTSTGGGFSIRIERFRLIDGKLEVVDDAVVPGKSHRIEGREIQLTLSDLSTTSPMGIDLALGLSGSGRGTIDGRIGPPPSGQSGSWPIDARVRLSDFIGGAAAPYLSTYTGLTLADGSLDLDATLKGEAPAHLDVAGTIKLKQLSIVPFGGNGAKSAKLDGSVVVDGTFTPDETRIRKADVRLGKAAVSLSGALTNLKTKPKAELRAVASKVAIGDVAPILSLFGPPLPPGLGPNGTISVDATASGPMDDPMKMDIKGTATIAGFTLADPSLKEPVKDIAASLSLSGGTAKLTGLAASLGRSRVSGSCTISRFTRPVIDVDLDVPLLDVDEILSFLPASGAAPAPLSSGSGSGSATTGSSMLRDVTVRGKLTVREAKAMNLKLTGANAQLLVQDGQARLDGIRASLYGGTLSGAVTAGLIESGPPFSMAAKIEGVDFNGLCTDFSKDLKGLIHGTLATSLDVKGRGLDTAGLRANLGGGATLALRNGKLTSFGFLKQLAEVLEAAGGRGVGRDETPFDSLTGTFAIRGGRAETSDLRLDSPDLDINAKGSIGLDQSLAMIAEVLLSPAVATDMVAKTPKLHSLVNGKGELALSLKLGGSLQKPAIGIDPAMLRRVAEDTLKKKGSDLLKRYLEKKKP